MTKLIFLSFIKYLNIIAFIWPLTLNLDMVNTTLIKGNYIALSSTNRALEAPS